LPPARCHALRLNPSTLCLCVVAQLMLVSQKGHTEYEHGENRKLSLQLPANMQDQEGGFLCMLHWGLPTLATETLFFPETGEKREGRLVLSFFLLCVCVVERGRHAWGGRCMLARVA
jgi:hypothetical protein